MLQLIHQIHPLLPHQVHMLYRYVVDSLCHLPCCEHVPLRYDFTQPALNPLPPLFQVAEVPSQRLSIINQGSLTNIQPVESPSPIHKLNPNLIAEGAAPLLLLPVWIFDRLERLLH